MPRARKRTLAIEKTSARVRAMRPRVITGATSLRRGGRRRRRGLSLVLARALGLELVGADHPAGGRVLADDHHVCLLYTSDAADDLLCVDLGGRRIIKKQKI